ncbi:hypothetical protein NZJ93_02410 [Desulfofundulus thermocisternus]|nr:hypothetical protein [Desulfofundulus thermocisternus]
MASGTGWMKKNSFSFYKVGGKPEKVTGDFTTKKRGANKKNIFTIPYLQFFP